MSTFKTTQSDLLQHDGKSCKILRELTEQEVDLHEVGKMFEIELSSGEKIHVFEDEILIEKVEIN